MIEPAFGSDTDTSGFSSLSGIFRFVALIVGGMVG